MKLAKTLRIAALTALAAFAFTGSAAIAQTGGAFGAARIALDRNFIIGSWTDDGDCAMAVAFMSDGSFTTAEGSEGQWSLEGNALTLTGASGTNILRVAPLDRFTMDVLSEDGALGRSTRCGGDLGTVHFDAPRIA
jgi:hypothetical protein